jgi:hypothetical protein
MRAMILQKESNAPKPLTFGLFAFRAAGLQPLEDN